MATVNETTDRENVPADIADREVCECGPKDQHLVVCWPFLHYVCKECGGLKV